MILKYQSSIIVKRFLILFCIISFAFFSCKNDEGITGDLPINIDGVLDSIHGEPVNLNISFKYYQDGTLAQISSYYTDYPYGSGNSLLKISYPDNSKIKVYYDTYIDGPHGNMTIYYSDSRIDSVYTTNNWVYSCRGQVLYSYYHYLDEEVLQIDSLACDDGYPSKVDTIHWLLNDKEQIIKKYIKTNEGVIQVWDEYKYDEMVNPLSHSFFQIVYSTSYSNRINHRTLFPILQKNNMILAEMEIDYNSDGMPVKIKLLRPPQYYLHYSY